YGARQSTGTSRAPRGCGWVVPVSTAFMPTRRGTRSQAGTRPSTRCSSETMVDPVRAIADAVLYEGYILWPYRRSALKNQRRFTFGGVYPPDHTARHPDDPSMMRAEVLVLGDPHLEVTVRFLHVVQRTVLDADDQAVDERV